VSGGEPSRRDPNGTAVPHGTDALVASGRKACDTDLQGIAVVHGKLLSEQDDGVIEGVTFHDPGLANGFRTGADRELKLGHERSEVA
jgi:hypothetical protein